MQKLLVTNKTIWDDKYPPMYKRQVPHRIKPKQEKCTQKKKISASPKLGIYCNENSYF